MVGPSFSGETDFKLKILSRMLDRHIYLITQSPPEQYSHSKIKNNQKGEEIKSLTEYENAFKDFGDVLGTSNCNLIDQFFIRIDIII